MAQAQSEVSGRLIMGDYENFVGEQNLAELQPAIDDLVLDQPFLSDERRDRDLGQLILEYFENKPDSDITTKELALLMVTALHQLIEVLLPNEQLDIQEELERQEVILRDPRSSLSERKEAFEHKKLNSRLLEILRVYTQAGEVLLAVTAAIALLVKESAEVAKDSEAAKAIEAFDDELETFFMPLVRILGIED